MKKEVYINTRANIHAVALVENGNLVEFSSEAENDASIFGNIYKGKVEQVIKGMQAAFVNIGRKKNGYLYVGNIYVDGKEITNNYSQLSNRINVKPGEDILVQVSKTEVGMKGARLTTNISFAGRYLVYLPYVNYIGVSRKIEDENIRNELVNYVESIPNREGGYIIRTAAEDVGKEELLADSIRLSKRYKSILEKYDKAKPTEIIHKDGDIIQRTVRDMVSKDVDKIVVNNKKTYKEVKEAIKHFGGDEKILEMFEEKDIDLFNYYGLSGDILHIIDKKVPLENGANLIIEHTEAMTIIDVNTGSFTGTTDLEDTVFETNVLAAKVVASQLRLRNIGGIIMVDFIDMLNEDHKRALFEIMTEAVKTDRVRTQVVDMTKLGIIEITRKKSREETVKRLLKPCKYCGGKGYLMSNQALVSLIRTKLFEIFNDKTVTAVKVSVNKENEELFIVNNAFTFEINVFWQDKRIYIDSDNSLSDNDYNIKIFNEGVLELSNTATLLF